MFITKLTLFLVFCTIVSRIDSIPQTDIDQDNDGFDEDQTSTTLSPSNTPTIGKETLSSSTPKQVSSQPQQQSIIKSIEFLNGFDIEFLNQSNDRLIRFYNEQNNDDDERCILDELIDQLVPNGFRINHQFDLDRAYRTENLNETFHIIENLFRLNQNLTALAQPLINQLVTRLSFLAYEIQLSSDCLKSLLEIINGLRSREIWSLKCNSS